MWGATPKPCTSVAIRDISIHAPRVGSDIEHKELVAADYDFNPRSPCGERLARIGEQPVYNYISIHAPRVGSDLLVCSECGKTFISIHAPRVGSDSGYDS